MTPPESLTLEDPVNHLEAPEDPTATVQKSQVIVRHPASIAPHTNCDRSAFERSLSKVGKVIPDSEKCRAVTALGNEIAKLGALINAATHKLLLSLREFDALGGWGMQGARTYAAWLSWRIGCDLGAAREKIRVARALAELPNIDSEFRRGHLSYSKVRAMTRVATARNEERLCRIARYAPGAQMEKICRKYRRVVEGNSLSDSKAAPGEERYLHHRVIDEGLVKIEMQVHPDEAKTILEALHAARRAWSRDVSAETSETASTPASRDVSAETRPTLVDAITLLAESYLARGPASRCATDQRLLLVHLGPDVLEGGSAWRAELPDGSPVSAETLRRVACDCGLVAVRTGDDGEPLDVGRRRRSIPAALRRALLVRDRHCRFPGCNHDVFLDGHHIEHWAHGGETKLSNLVLLCHAHHTLIHEGGYRVGSEDGVIFFRDAAGRIIEEAPWVEVRGDAVASLEGMNESGEIETNPKRLGGFGEPVDYDGVILGLVCPSRT